MASATTLAEIEFYSAIRLYLGKLVKAATSANSAVNYWKIIFPRGKPLDRVRLERVLLVEYMGATCIYSPEQCW